MGWNLNLLFLGVSLFCFACFFFAPKKERSEDHSIFAISGGVFLFYYFIFCWIFPDVEQESGSYYLEAMPKLFTLLAITVVFGLFFGMFVSNKKIDDENLQGK